MIIGFYGRMGSGKDTLADYWINYFNNDYIKVGFADGIRYFCTQYLNLSRDEMFDESKKNELSCIHWGKMPHWLETGKDFYALMTYREILQEVGTGVGRRLNNDFWLNYLESYLSMTYGNWGDSNFIIKDVRFKNEVDWIHQNNGVLIKLTRDKFNNKHVSESLDLPNNFFNFTIDNQHLSLDESYKKLNDIYKEIAGS